jgi:hypothetical protein
MFHLAQSLSSPQFNFKLEFASFFLNSQSLKTFRKLTPNSIREYVVVAMKRWNCSLKGDVVKLKELRRSIEKEWERRRGRKEEGIVWPV